MRILVTGMAGFIGYHTAMALAEHGHEVIGVDNFNEYYDLRLKNFRVKELERKGISCRKLELSDYDQTYEVFKEIKPEIVIHLAAQAGVRYSIDNPHAYIKSNIDAFLNILESCRHHGVRRLVYASSSSVYGGITELPFSEKMQVDQPISLYAATKKSNELMAHSYAHLYKFETIGLRFFTVYGPCGRPDMAMWLFADAILKGKPIKVFNHGKMKRDFTYVSDIVRGIEGTVNCEMNDRYKVYNLGNHRSEELESVISYIEAGLGKKAERELLPMQPGDVPATFADVENAQKDLGFEPSMRLKDGVFKFISWYQEEWIPYLNSH